MAAAELNRTQERKANTNNGGFMLLVTLLLLVALVWMVIELIRYENGVSGVAVLVLSIAFTLALCGFYTLQPNEGAVITLFGNYKGTDRQPGLRWLLPWYSRK